MSSEALIIISGIFWTGTEASSADSYAIFRARHGYKKPLQSGADYRSDLESDLLHFKDVSA